MRVTVEDEQTPWTGVSHATISRAVDVLAAEGRLTVVRGWGTFVAERG